jgi:hypothetical protein
VRTIAVRRDRSESLVHCVDDAFAPRSDLRWRRNGYVYPAELTEHHAEALAC